MRESKQSCHGSCGEHLGVHDAWFEFQQIWQPRRAHVVAWRLLPKNPCHCHFLNHLILEGSNQRLGVVHKLVILAR